MKFRLIVLFLSVFFILPLGNIVSASEKTNSIVNKFETLQLSNDVLYEKALKGELINNRHTQVTVTENKEEGTKLIEVNKILSEEVLPNGDLITEHTKESTILVAGSQTETKAPPSYGVGMRVRIDFDAKKLGGYNARKITKYTLTPLQLDSQFSMTYYQHQAGTWGAGWKSDGKAHSTSESTTLKKVTNINYNLANPNTPNFVKYTPLNSYVWAGSNVNVKFNYRRGPGAILTYNFSSGW